ncbi:MAG: hypothetical protein C4518_04095 [Desulfobacteraceae bacterium]|nr:MAG: hypothetical protein C4518_04095 [Desulfobacteraceae bacterium]
MSEERIEKMITSRAVNKALSCKAAFELAGELGVSPGAMGAAADKLDIHLLECQLGLFGYKPEKKIVKPLDAVDPALESAIRSALVNDRLPCRVAWEIAELFHVEKMTVSAACETLGIKIRPCQLGAF